MQNIDPITLSNAQPYYAMIRSDDPKFTTRLQMVLYTLDHGIKAAVRRFRCARNTVRTWLQRYQQNHLQGLHEQSRAPKHCPHKTPTDLEDKVLALRAKTPGFGARRLIAEFDLSLGHAAYKPFTRFQMDTKHLDDLPFYWTQMQSLGLPRFQYTIRELSCGAQFLAYSQELSKTYATLAAERFLTHLKAHGIDTSEVVIQTDLGSEFDGDTRHYRAEGFHGTIQGPYRAEHRFNPPACPNANADVESVHGAIEGEFFDAQMFGSKADFFAKVATYQLWYNVARKNSSRQWKSPADLLAEKAPQISPKIFLLHPLPLESLLPAQGVRMYRGRP